MGLLLIQTPLSTSVVDVAPWKPQGSIYIEFALSFPVGRVPVNNPPRYTAVIGNCFHVEECLRNTIHCQSPL